jgi:hypothetical protein
VIFVNKRLMIFLHSTDGVAITPSTAHWPTHDSALPPLPDRQVQQQQQRDDHCQEGRDDLE